ADGLPSEGFGQPPDRDQGPRDHPDGIGGMTVTTTTRMRRLLLAGGLALAGTMVAAGPAAAFGDAPSGGITTATAQTVVAHYDFDSGTSSPQIRVTITYAAAPDSKSAVPHTDQLPAVVCANVTDCGSANMGASWPLP